MPVPVLLIVTSRAALVVLTCTLPNESEVGAIENCATTPVPVRPPVRVRLPPATTCTAADFAPTEVGRNVTEILQVAATATDAPQLLVVVKSALSGPVS